MSNRHQNDMIPVDGGHYPGHPTFAPKYGQPPVDLQQATMAPNPYGAQYTQNAPPYGQINQPLQPTHNPMYGPDSYNTDKPALAGPTAYGAASGMGMMPTPQEKRICGIRRKIFFIILAIVVLLVIAGLGAGLGVALTRKNDKSDVSQADRDREGSGAGGTSTSSSSIALPSETLGGGGGGDGFSSLGNDPVLPNPTTSDFTEPTTTPEDSPSPTPEDSPSPTPEDSPSPTPEDSPSPTPEDSPSPSPTPSPSPSPSPTTDPGDLIEPTTTPEDDTPTPTVFTLETGYNTLALTLASTTGDSALCAILLSAVSVTTTVYPYIVGNAEDYYTAAWTLDNGATFTAVGSPPQPTDEFAVWTFSESSSTTNAGGCQLDSADGISLEESGVGVYSAGVAFGNTCTIGTNVFSSGDFCFFYWAGEYTS